MSGQALEKRERQRYKLGLDLRFSYQRGGSTGLGSGTVRDLSDRAVCFENDFNAPDGAELELRIPWPERLQNVCDLELVVKGPLIRSRSGRAVLRIGSYEFQTCGERSFDHPPVWRTGCDIVG